MQKSPYTPGEISHIVPGREKDVTRFRRDLAFTAVDGALVGRVRVLVGPRGIGKTSLLRYMEKDARSENFSAVLITAGDGSFTEDFIAQERRSMGDSWVEQEYNCSFESLEGLGNSWTDTVRSKVRKLAESVQLSLGPVSVSGAAHASDPHRSASTGKALQDLVIEVTNQLTKRNSHGLCIFIDEIQEADAAGLRALTYAWQNLQAENPDLPAMVVAAGLGHSQDVITDAVSFSERFAFRSLARLGDDAERTALTQPAEGNGVRWEPEALESAMKYAAGYPYFLQVIGDEVWTAAGFPDAGATLTNADLEDALEAFHEDQEVFFRARWKKATRVEAELITAMAQLGVPVVKRAAVAEKMGRKTTDISMVRSSLIDKGIIQAPKGGYLEFTVPGFGDFIRHEIGDADSL